jgi:hypothetical protein
MRPETGRPIRVTIDTLAVHGLPIAPAQRGRLLRAVQEELSLSLERDRAAVDRALPAADAHERALDAGAITYDPERPIDPNTLGRAIARAVHGGLATWQK